MCHRPDRLRVEMAAPPQTEHYMSVGTAFDYLMRWYVEQRHPQKTEARDAWVAEEGAEMMWNGYCSRAGRREQMVMRDNVARGIGFPDGTAVDAVKDTAERAARLLSDGKAEYARYMRTGKADGQTAAAVLGLGSLDAVLRAHKVEHLMYDAAPDRGDIMDLLNLHSVLAGSGTMRDALDGARHIRLNPVFGKYSRLVGGADADIIAGDTLIDIKTTKSPEFKLDYWRQLLGYCALANASGAGIRRLGVYFSRFGVLAAADAPDADWTGIAEGLIGAWEKLLDGLQENGESA